MSCSSCSGGSPAGAFAGAASPFNYGGFQAAAAPLALGAYNGLQSFGLGNAAGFGGLGASPYALGGLANYGLNNSFAFNGPLGFNSLGSLGGYNGLDLGLGALSWGNNFANLGNFGNFGNYGNFAGLGNLGAASLGYGGLGSLGNLGYGAF